MVYPAQLAGARNMTTLMFALQQLANTALDLDTRAKAIQHAYASTAAAEYEANGAPAGTGTQYATLMANLATFLGTPAWTQMMAFVDAYRDVTR